MDSVRLPLIRTPWFTKGQPGVPGGDSVKGLRTSVLGNVFYVDPNYPNGGVGSDGTLPTNPLPTVASALAKCQPYHNDVIVVSPNGMWQYGKRLYQTTRLAESVTVNVDGVTIVADCQASPLGVVWEPATVNTFCITLAALDVRIEGFTFSGQTLAGNGIYAEWDGATCWADNIIIRNCIFDGDIDTAIQLEYAWFCIIEGCKFYECDTAGIYVDPLGSGIAYCSLKDNLFHDCALALSLQGADDCEIVGNRIFNSNAQAAAVATDEGIDTTGGSGNLVADNYLSCLLPVPANGDWNDFCSGSATDAWVNCHLMDGDSVTNPT